MSKPLNEWQVEFNNIRTRMAKMYETKSWTDCVFLFGSDELVPAHRNVLAAASPVFAAMFFGGMPESDGPIRIDDILPDTFTAVLKYIYSDVIKIDSFDDASAFYYVAHKYMLSDLQKQCVKYFRVKMREHCCLAYELAQVFDDVSLLNACEKFMETYTMDVLGSSGYLAASPSTVHFMYSMDKLAIKRELDLFEALERYIEGRKEQNEEPPLNAASVNNEIGLTTEQDNAVKDIKQKNTKNKNEEDEDINDRTAKDSNGKQITTRHIMKLIRFRVMSVKEFVSVPAVSPYLTQEERLSILINLNDPTSSVPLPEGFSTKIEKRYKEQRFPQEKSRSIAKFNFTAIECCNLENANLIIFPAVYIINVYWHVVLQLKDNDVFVKIQGESVNRYRNLYCKLSLVSKTGELDNYKFSGSNYSNVYATGLGGHEMQVGSLGKWKDFKSKYMDDEGALNFYVELQVSPKYML